MKRCIILAVVCLPLWACTLYQISSDDTTLTFYAPKASTAGIEYLDTVTQPHEVIATVTVNAERNQSMDEILGKMKQEAAELGGDALTNMRTNAGTGRWASVKPHLLKNSHVRANFVVDVVAFTR